MTDGVSVMFNIPLPLLGVISALIVSLLVIVIFNLLFSDKYSKTKLENDPQVENSEAPEFEENIQQNSGRKPVNRKSKPLQQIKTAKRPIDKYVVVPDNPYHLDTLKIGQGVATCVAIDNEATKIAVGCSDSSIKVSSTRHTPTSGWLIRSVLSDRDVPTALDFAVDGASLFVALEYRSTLLRMNIPSPETKTKTLNIMFTGAVSMHHQIVKHLISSKGRWILTSAGDEDTELKLWDYNGDSLAIFDTKQVKLYTISCSPRTGRFFGACGWSAGIKLYEVITKRDGEFSKAVKVIDLPTACGTMGLALSHNDKRAIAVTKDRRLIYWNIDVRYKANEEAKELLDVQLPDETEEHFTTDRVLNLAFSSDDSLIFCSFGKHVVVLSSTGLNVLYTIHDMHRNSLDRLILPSVLNASYFITMAGDEKPRMWKISSQPLDMETTIHTDVQEPTRKR